jgi:hypothetical protein
MWCTPADLHVRQLFAHLVAHARAEAAQGVHMGVGCQALCQRLHVLPANARPREQHLHRNQSGAASSRRAACVTHTRIAKHTVRRTQDPRRTSCRCSPAAWHSCSCRSTVAVAATPWCAHAAFKVRSSVLSSLASSAVFERQHWCGISRLGVPVVLVHWGHTPTHPSPVNAKVFPPFESFAMLVRGRATMHAGFSLQ